MYRLIEEIIFAFARLIEHTHNIQQSRFACPAGTHDGYKFSF
jgi:hypothetical protein